MAIPNPFEKPAAAVKKVPPKVWAIAIGGGVVVYFVVHSRNSNAADANAAAADAAGNVDPGSLQGSPAVEDSSLPGVYPTGAGQGASPYDGSATAPVDLGLPIATDGVPAVDSTTTGAGAPDAVGVDGSGVLTLNIVTSAAPGIKPKTTHKKVAPKRHHRHKPKGAGGMPHKKHPSSVHGNPKRPIKRGSPHAHTEHAPAHHTPVGAPEPPKRHKQKAAPKRPQKRRLFAHPNRPHNRKRKR